jgi:hypothetical protein
MPGGMDDFLNLYPPSDRTEKEKRRGEYKRKTPKSRTKNS